MSWICMVVYVPVAIVQKHVFDQFFLVLNGNMTGSLKCNRFGNRTINWNLAAAT